MFRTNFSIMYKWILSVLVITMVACSTGTQNEESAQKETPKEEIQDAASNVFGTYGQEISEDGAITPLELMLEMEGKDSLAVTLEAEIESCCKKKGCWMNVQVGNGEQLKVTFKDYGFDAYSQVIFAPSPLIAANPRTIHQFLTATFAGWRWAIHHPTETAQLLTQKYVEPDYRNLEYQTQSLLKIANYVQTDNHPIGVINPDRCQLLS